jgi:hypothetical protein
LELFVLPAVVLADNMRPKFSKAHLHLAAAVEPLMKTQIQLGHLADHLWVELVYYQAEQAEIVFVQIMTSKVIRAQQAVVEQVLQSQAEQADLVISQQVVVDKD